MKLFEYVILHHPRVTKAQEEKGENSKSAVIVDLKRVLAKGEKEALMMAARDIPDGYMEKLDQVEIALRPF